MTVTPASPSVALSAALLSVDLRYRGHEYRLAEAILDESTVRIDGMNNRACSECPRVIGATARYVREIEVREPVRIIRIMHPKCAIRVGALIHMPRCQEQDAIDAALAERADAEAERLRALDAAREAGVPW